ncbi:hypothetical protein [Anaerocolumna jejuensis]|uniref:hypothetical protein n=1 Tax=Anaerocolumna jejuensis TaxID=259063 RepID=UPI003F7B3BBA
MAKVFINMIVNILYRILTVTNMGKKEEFVNKQVRIFTPFHKVIHKSSTICG